MSVECTIKKQKNKISRFNKTIRIIGYFLTIISIIYIVWIGYLRWQEVAKIFYILNNWQIITLSIFIYALFYILIIFSWKLIIKGLGESIQFKDSYIIFGRSQIARYIPGNIFHYVGRHILAKNLRLPNSIIISSIFLESILIIAGSGLLALIAVLIFSWQRIIFFSVNRLLLFSGIIVFIVFLFLICIKFIPRFKKWLINNSLLIEIKTINLKKLFFIIVLVLFIYIFFFIGTGSIIWVLSKYFWPKESLSIFIFIGAYPISWVAGFITPGAPGGIGVREIVLITLLKPYLGESKALILSLIFRLITILGDFLLFISTYFFKTKLHNYINHKK
jgi:glycosyltransferase 2 family protein